MIDATKLSPEVKAAINELGGLSALIGHNAAPHKVAIPIEVLQSIFFTRMYDLAMKGNVALTTADGGDAGLQIILDKIEKAMKRARPSHRRRK